MNCANFRLGYINKNKIEWELNFMEALKQILIIAIATTFLGGCLSTNGPIIFDEFKTNDNDSFAKTTMRLGGSNKFVDSKAGEDVTRDVAGKNVNRAMQVLSFNFMGLMQDSITDSMIENEPLAESPYFIVEFDGVSEHQATTEQGQKELITQAELKLVTLMESVGFQVGEKDTKTLHDRTLFRIKNQDEKCFNFKEALGIACHYRFANQKVTAYDKQNKKVYVGLKSDNMPLALHLAANYKENDVRLYIPHRYVTYTYRLSTYQVAEAAMVIHAGKAHKFVRGATQDDGIDLNELKFNYGRKEKQNNDKKTLFKVNPFDLSYTEVPLN